MADSAPSKGTTSSIITAAIDKAQTDIIAALERLAAELPVGYAVDAVEIDVLTADRQDGTKDRRFVVGMSIGV